MSSSTILASAMNVLLVAEDKKLAILINNRVIQIVTNLSIIDAVGVS